jgi:hypothetical protein
MEVFFTVKVLVIVVFISGGVITTTAVEVRGFFNPVDFILVPSG